MSIDTEMIRDDYLWDRSPPVDDEVVRLERLLSPYAYKPVPVVSTSAPVPSVRVPHARRRWRTALAAAAVLATLSFGVRTWYQQRLQWPEAQAWQVASVRGDVLIDGHDATGATALAPGKVLETGDGVVRLHAARIGEVAIGKGSRFTLVETRSGRHRVQLQQGRMWARVWAPPGTFGVGTPTAGIWDMGCEFVLTVNAEGDGLLTVRSGWVQVDNGWSEAMVPQGARVEMDARGVPGTPYDLGASQPFIAALRDIDAQAGTVDEEAVRRLIAASRPRDAISLLSLLTRRPQLAEGPLFDRVAQLMPADVVVTREAIRVQGAHALSPWWNTLPYPRVKRWWVQWPDAFATRTDVEKLLRISGH
ncbi:hypothetical protein [Lysobacter sp. CFH 32150]|uniref:hypothetical protein n=1 Tax=Lysobacter sp. CFH 32150 TaxID=2927128 RepID=UPI001FA80F2D|nr:hypothetical protein [Lysobacter sp. CFH 32150]MCI4568250.1 hypothetical protein [Lysobacter sp. CFH 32150]